jgi:ubiquinone/menaquinone biosynthesis C-methylase UbiE
LAVSRYAILIGNGDFPNSNSTLPPLETPVKDVGALAELLMLPRVGPFKVAPPLIDSPASMIFKGITDLLKEASAGAPELVLIYYSGHGILDQNNRLVLAAYDTDRLNPANEVRFADLIELIDRAKLPNVLVILDCCWSGAAGRALPLEPRSGPNQEMDDAGFDEQTTASIRRARRRNPLEARSQAAAVYVLTSSSAAQKSYGNVSDGHGLFTKYLLSGLGGKATDSSVEADAGSISVVTLDSLFRHVYSGLLGEGVLQIPRLYTKGAPPSTLVVAQLQNLAGNHDFADFRLWDEPEVLENLLPTYILDDNYRFLHWNAAFQTLVAEPLRLRRGSHVQTFLERLENWRTEVKPTSLRDFPADVPRSKHPRVHSERFVYRADEFGLIEFQKLASGLRDGTGNWCVTLSISYAERSDEVWGHLLEGIRRDELWSRYAGCYDEIIAAFAANKDLVNAVVLLAGDAKNCIDVGAGTGSTTIKLLETKADREVYAVDSNYRMLARLKSNLDRIDGLATRARICHADCLSALAHVSDETFDACVMMNVFFALDHPLENLRIIRSKLKYGGKVVISTSDETTDIEELFWKIRAWLVNNQLWDTKESLFNEALERNRQMVPIVRRYTRADVEQFLQDAQFADIQLAIERTYENCVFVMTAVKKQEMYLDQSTH